MFYKCPVCAWKIFVCLYLQWFHYIYFVILAFVLFIFFYIHIHLCLYIFSTNFPSNSGYEFANFLSYLLGFASYFEVIW